MSHLSPKSVVGYAWQLYALEQHAGTEDIDALTEKQVLKFLSSIQANSSYNYALAILKRYYQKFLGKKNFLRDIKQKKTTKRVLEIRQEDIDWMIEACRTSRDKCLISVLTEYGFRIGEALAIQMKHVEYDANSGGYYLSTPSGKTGSRRVLGIASSARIAAWLEDHPQRNNPEAFLFCSRHERMDIEAVHMLFFHVKKRAKQAHPDLRHIYPHLLRHWSATNAAKLGMNETAMKQRFGWTDRSQTPGVYIHASNKMANDAYATKLGIKIPEDKPENTFVKCPKCHQNNAPSAKWCPNCGSPISVVAAAAQADKAEGMALFMQMIQKMQQGVPFEEAQKVFQVKKPAE